SWFVGYTKEMSTAVSLSRVDPKTQELLPLKGLGGSGTAGTSGTGSTYAIDIWTRYMKAVTQPS
ncbi:hypothetical protein AB4Z54_24790, partial [Streptomyces sp. MCAF7]